MNILNAPPRIKVLEALGAIADNRIEVLDDSTARVVSSEGDRVYTVKLNLNDMTVFSNDNGTMLRGYVGYPIIAFLMIKGLLPFDKRLAESLRGIPWRRLNERYKRYFLVEKVVKEMISRKGVNPKEVDTFVNTVLAKLRNIKLRLDRNLQPPVLG